MPSFDLRGIRAGAYTNTSGTISYTNHTSVGDAMTANLELRYAEGRLYAESTLAEYVKQATGGTISLGVKYIPAAAQKLLFDAKDSSRTVGTATMTGLKFSAKDEAKYVGIVFYAPDMIDGVQKYTCVFVPKVMFGPPGMSFQTKGENIQFQTPTTTGEFLADDSTGKLLIETATADDETKAIAWCMACLGET